MRKIKQKATDLACFIEASEEMEIKISDTLEEVTDWARQMVMSHILEEVIAYYEHEENVKFPELLRAWSDYALLESAKDREVTGKTTWMTIHLMLSNAVSKLDSDQPKNDFNAPIELAITLRISRYCRRLYLLQCVIPLTRGLERERFRFANLLTALSRYAQSESDHHDDIELWNLVAQILHDAAEASQKDEEELP